MRNLPCLSLEGPDLTIRPGDPRVELGDSKIDMMDVSNEHKNKGFLGFRLSTLRLESRRTRHRGTRLLGHYILRTGRPLPYTPFGYFLVSVSNVFTKDVLFPLQRRSLTYPDLLYLVVFPVFSRLLLLSRSTNVHHVRYISISRVEI